MEACKKVLETLKNYQVVLDDSEDNFGYKNAIYDYKGASFKVIVSIVEGQEQFTLVSRYNHEKLDVSLDQLNEMIYIKNIRTKKDILKTNRRELDKKSVMVRDGLVDYNLVNIVPWCGENCFTKETNLEYLIPFHQYLSSVPCYSCGKLNKKFIYIFKINNEI